MERPPRLTSRRHTGDQRYLSEPRLCSILRESINSACRSSCLTCDSYRHQPASPGPNQTSFSASSSSDPFVWVFSTLQRLLLISDFTMVSRLILLLPIFGRPLAFGYMCIINSYYCFEWAHPAARCHCSRRCSYTFTSRGWSLDHRILYMQERLTYMIGFGKLPGPTQERVYAS